MVMKRIPFTMVLVLTSIAGCVNTRSNPQPLDRHWTVASNDCDYAEDFTHSPQDWSAGSCDVKWCAGIDWDKKNGCPAPGSIRVDPGNTTTARLFYCFGDLRPSALRISFNYSQYVGQSPFDNAAESYLEYRESNDPNFDCPKSSHFKCAKQLNRTWRKARVCSPEPFELPLKRGTRGVYWQFRKRKPHDLKVPPLHIDDLHIVPVFDQPERDAGD